MYFFAYGFYFVFANVYYTQDQCGYRYGGTGVEQFLRPEFQCNGECTCFVDVPPVGEAVGNEMVFVWHLLAIDECDPILVVGLAKDKVEGG